MIQSLRTAHRRVFVALAFILPTLLVAGLGARRQQSRAADRRVSQMPTSFQLVKRSGNLWQKHSLQVEFYRDSSRTGKTDVVLNPAEDWNEPDLLLYWSPESPEGNSLPPKAQLMGPFVTGNVFRLPNSDSGYLILFSLAHQIVFDVARVEKLP
jgi:hypothetical protein